LEESGGLCARQPLLTIGTYLIRSCVIDSSTARERLIKLSAWSSVIVPKFLAYSLINVYFSSLIFVSSVRY
jgi:hypothetical protein